MNLVTPVIKGEKNMKATGKVLTIIILVAVVMTTLYLAVTNVVASPKNKPKDPTMPFRVYRYTLPQYETVYVPSSGTWTVPFPEFVLTPDSVDSVIIGASLELETENVRGLSVYVGIPDRGGGRIFHLFENPFDWTVLRNYTPMNFFSVGSSVWWGPQQYEIGTLPVAGLDNYPFSFGFTPWDQSVPIRVRNLVMKIYYLDNALVTGGN
jgi:hypothetical protein